MSGRVYSLPCGVLPSVTSVLRVIDKPALAAWQRKVAVDALKDDVRKSGALSGTALDEAAARAMTAPDRIASKAASFGTRAHAVIDSIVKSGDDGEDVAVPPGVAPIVSGFRQWAQQCGLTLHRAGDTVVFSEKYQYAGALDVIGHRTSDGAVVIVDFKTSNQIQDTFALQLAAYARAYQEMNGPDPPVVGAVAVRFDKSTGAVEERRVADLDVAFAGFKAALLLHRLQSTPLFAPSSVIPGVEDVRE